LSAQALLFAAPLGQRHGSALMGMLQMLFGALGGYVVRTL